MKFYRSFFGAVNGLVLSRSVFSRCCRRCCSFTLFAEFFFFAYSPNLRKKNSKGDFFGVTFNFAFILFTFLLFGSCASPPAKNRSVSSASSAINDSNNSSPKIPHFSSKSIEVKIFEVTDNSGRSQGWGYDIYVQGHKTIHQPIIPAVPGNNSFKTRDDAQKVGSFAIGKMLKEGTLPTILVAELDSLGITH